MCNEQDLRWKLDEINRALDDKNRVTSKHSNIESEIKPDEYIFVKTGYDWVRIDLHLLLYIEDREHYLYLGSANLKIYCKRSTRVAETPVRMKMTKFNRYKLPKSGIIKFFSTFTGTCP